ncbi:MAG: RNA polymerase sporulation sigma factor SigK [Oscillospiraceae bacterium]|nr:RNA polymerase sporulation sigma factor SigK [Oscillospiraceae bacterium]MBR3474605.1 RNA polymerase sporulation sigma factor SigK [Oscillospiraceae bacterium]
MIESAWFLLLQTLFWMLRVSPGGSFPRTLSKAEEQAYLARWAEGDLEARNLLVEHNLRLVAHIVKKYYAHTEDVDDLISIGTIGLIKGINSYRPEKGVKLSSYVSRCIENEILMAFRGKRKSEGDVSLSEALDVEEEGGALSYLDVLAQEDDLAERIGSAELCRQLREAVDAALTPREAEIVRLRYGLQGGEPMTQRQLAEGLGISRSYVSRIEKKALEKLRSALEERGETG